MSDEKQPDFQPEFVPPDSRSADATTELDRLFACDTKKMMSRAEAILSRIQLSILLCTVETRAALFAKLHTEISRQASGRSVEVLVACDNKEISIGKKRQNLLEQATGDWVCFIDDDDWIAPTYVDEILAALATKPDCVGFKLHCTTNGMNPQSAIASMRYPKWVENTDGYGHCRSIYHKTPTRRNLALQVGFPDLRYAEDKVFSTGIMKLVTTEAFIDKVLYFYRYRTEPFAQKFGIVSLQRVNARSRSGKPSKISVSRKHRYGAHGEILK